MCAIFIVIYAIVSINVPVKTDVTSLAMLFVALRSLWFSFRVVHRCCFCKTHGNLHTDVHEIWLYPMGFKLTELD